jgi:hypothetical protein
VASTKLDLLSSDLIKASASRKMASVGEKIMNLLQEEKTLILMICNSR